MCQKRRRGVHITTLSGGTCFVRVAYIHSHRALFVRASLPLLVDFLYSLQYPPPSEQGASAIADRVLRLCTEDDDLDADGLLPRSMDVCHHYLLALAKDGQWEQALGFFRELVGRGRPPPDQNCYDAVLRGLNKAKRWVETAEVMDTFRRQSPEQRPHDFKPRRSLYLSALSTLLQVVSGGGREGVGPWAGRGWGGGSPDGFRGAPVRCGIFSARELVLHAIRACLFQRCPLSRWGAKFTHDCRRWGGADRCTHKHPALLFHRLLFTAVGGAASRMYGNIPARADVPGPLEAFLLSFFPSLYFRLIWYCAYKIRTQD